MVRNTLVALVLCAALAAGAFAADVVRMENGDVISGRVTSVGADKTIVKTDYAGDVTVDSKKVVSITTVEPLSVKTSEGVVSVGKVEYTRDSGFTVAAESGPVSVALAQLAAAVTPETAAKAARPQWSGSAELGVNGQTGNSEILAGNARVDVRRQYQRQLFTAYALARYGREDGLISANQQRAAGRYEEKVSAKYFWYGDLMLEHDEIKDLAIRATASAGLGRIWWESGKNWMKTSAGPGVSYEKYQSDGDETSAVVQVTNDYSKAINSTMTLTNLTTLLFDVSDVKGFRADNDAALAFPLSARGDWQLKLGLSNQYDNSPAPGRDRLDTYYYLNALRKF